MRGPRLRQVLRASSWRSSPVFRFQRDGSVRSLRSQIQWDLGRRTGHMLTGVWRAALAVGIAALAGAPGAHGATLANRCVAMSAGSSFGRFYVKPTGRGIM